MEWAGVHEIVTRMTRDTRGAVRLTDLAIAASAACRFGLVAGSRRVTCDGPALRDVVAGLALYPLLDVADSGDEWRLLAQAAAVAANDINSTRAIHEWIAASQAADPGRKTRGAYATPMSLARLLAAGAITPLVRSSRPIRVVDPSVGSGALLIAVLRLLGKGAEASELRLAVSSLYGVEVDPAARELCCLLLWVAAARAKPSLKQIAANIVVDNALTRNWWTSIGYPFDAVVMNPPWESLRHSVPHTDPDAAVRAATLIRLQGSAPGADGLPPLYTAQGRGDRNLFKAFVELAPHLLSPSGRLAALIPAAFGSDLGMLDLRQRYLDEFALERWTTFENLRRLFPIDGRYKFGVLIGQRSLRGTKVLAVRGFASDPAEVKAEHVPLAREELRRVGGRARMLPELRSRFEKDTLLRALEKGTPFFSRGAFGIVRYRREVDLTFGRAKGVFSRFDSHQSLTSTCDGTFLTTDGARLVPVLEGRMVGQYDFFQKSWAGGVGRTARWEMNYGRSLDGCRPQFVARSQGDRVTRVAICDVTSATNTRTVHATLVPPTWPCGNTAPTLVFESEVLALAGLGVLNSMVFDWLARRLVSGLHLNRFYLDALVWPALTQGTVERLAAAAYVLCTTNARFEAGVGSTYSPLETGNLTAESAHVLIEQEVARGFGLTRQMLGEMLASDRSDRRGLWRHFALDAGAVTIAERVLNSSIDKDEFELV